MKAPQSLSRENIEWAVRLYGYLRRRPLARYGGILILGALALYSNILQLLIVGGFLLAGQQVPNPEPPEVVFYAMIGAGVLLIVLDRVLPEKTVLPTAYPHDEKLMQKVRNTYTPRVDDFLRVHAFGNRSFEFDILNPLYEFRVMRGSQHDFINEQVNGAWKSVREAGNTLLRKVSDNTISVRGSIGRVTPFRDDEDPDWHTQEMIDRCTVMDDAADKFVEEWDKFDAIARRQIPNIV